MTNTTNEELNTLRSLLPCWNVLELQTDEGEDYICVTVEEIAYSLWNLGDGLYAGACVSNPNGSEMFQGGVQKVARVVNGHDALH